MPEKLSQRDVVRLRKAMANSQNDSFFKHLKNLLRAKLRFDTLLILAVQSEWRAALSRWLAAPHSDAPSRYGTIPDGRLSARPLLPV